jgi:hypothetical protein
VRSVTVGSSIDLTGPAVQEPLTALRQWQQDIISRRSAAVCISAALLVHQRFCILQSLDCTVCLVPVYADFLAALF